MNEKKKIGFLGPRGSYSWEAAIITDGEILPFPDIEKLFEVFLEGKMDKIVLPIENLIEGGVNPVFDGMINGSNFSIEAEIIMPVNQVLIGAANDIKEIKSVISHPQALAQCSRFISRHSFIVETASSTSEAVRIVALKNDPVVAAIGSERAFKIFKAENSKLRIILIDISNYKDNKTRFVVLSRKESKPTGNDKTSIVFQTRNLPGSLWMAITPFAILRINMAMIISRPSKRKLGEYVYWVDFIGHRADRKVRLALWLMRKAATFFKVLGSYPVCKGV